MHPYVLQGIGKAYAFEFAKKGLKVVLISRTVERLQETAKEITAKVAGATVEVVQADFSKGPEHGDYARIAKALAGKQIGILVNNVGCSYPSALFFHELDAYSGAAGGGQEPLTRQMVTMNITSVVEMTKIVLPGMVERKNGAIINVASAAGASLSPAHTGPVVACPCPLAHPPLLTPRAGRVPIGNPMYALYSGTKAFVDYFSRSLHHEYSGKGVVVTCQSPYFVATKLAKIRHASLFAPSPSTYAKAAVAAIGDGDSTVPYWAHWLQDTIARAAPAWLLHWQLMSMHMGLRKRYLKKLEDEKKK